MPASGVPQRPPRAPSAPSRAVAFLKGPARRRARDVAREARLWPRRALGERLALPSFLIVGARKGGTTSLFEYLVEHPEVRPPLWKAVRFFDRNWERGLGWYRASFPVRQPGERFVTGESTASYLDHPLAPERIARTLPEARLVALLRNPIDRAVSDYAHEVRQGGETRPMEQVLSPRNGDEAYLTRGLYAEQLRRYLAHVPRERLLVLRSERFFDDPAAGYARTLQFLGLSPFDDVEMTPRNVGGYARDGRFDRDALAAYFRPHNEALSELLGEDFTDWA